MKQFSEIQTFNIRSYIASSMNSKALLQTVQYIRISLGSAIALGLIDSRIETSPTTLYMLTYYLGKCSANCLFCSQARSSKARADQLSRIVWPRYELASVLQKLKAVDDQRFERICLQTLNYPNMFDDLLYIISRIRQHSNLPLSVSCQPLNGRSIKRLKSLGVDRLCIPLDAANEQLFRKVKGDLADGPYSWKSHLDSLRRAVGIFGMGKVTTHLIVGLGETDQDLLSILQSSTDLGILTSLFAFSPIRGTSKENDSRPSLTRYRILQLVNYLISKRIATIRDFQFNNKGEIITSVLSLLDIEKYMQGGQPFQTYGCDGCNRPYYNEPVSGPIYNYPRKLTLEELEETKNIVRNNWNK